MGWPSKSPSNSASEGSPKGERDPFPPGVRQPIDVVEPAAANDPNHGLRCGHTRLSGLVNVGPGLAFDGEEQAGKDH